MEQVRFADGLVKSPRWRENTEQSDMSKQKPRSTARERPGTTGQQDTRLLGEEGTEQLFEDLCDRQ